MKYAVLFYSETGNTKKVAEEIYRAIDSWDKVLVNIEESTQLPQADLYFVGFPIRKNNCGVKIVDCLEQIEQGQIALFATCGMKPTEKYQKKLENTLNIWLPDDAEYLGMFLCQGRTTPEQRTYFCNANPEYREKLEDMLDEGEHHPDGEDLARAEYFVQTILQKCGV